MDCVAKREDTSAVVEKRRVAGGVAACSRELTSLAPSDALPFVLVHGYGISGRSMLPTARALSRRHPCYVPDLPGHGSSDPLGKPLTVAALAEWLVQYVDELGLEKVALVANSAGCLVTLDFAARQPHRFASLALVAPVGGRRAYSPPQLAARLLLGCVREPPALAVIAVKDYVRFGVGNAIGYLQSMRSFEFPDQLGPAHGRVVVILGERDLLVNKAAVFQRADERGDVTIATIHHAAHAPNFSHPDAVARIATSFMDGRLIAFPGVEVQGFRPLEATP